MVAQIQYRALVDALTALCNLKGISANKLHVWLECALRDLRCPPASTTPQRSSKRRSRCRRVHQAPMSLDVPRGLHATPPLCVSRVAAPCSYVSIPQVNVTLKQLAIDSLAVYASAVHSWRSNGS